MVWYVLSVIGAVADAGYYISVKRYLKIADPLILAAGGYMSAGLALLLTSWLRGFPPLGTAFIPALVVSSVLGIVSILLSFAALRDTDISLAVPMISFTPLFLIVTSFLLLGEVPSAVGIAGIIIIVTGSYVLNLSSADRGPADPLRSVMKNRGMQYMLIVSFLYAVAINSDKVIVVNSDPFFASAVTLLILGISFCAMSKSGTARDLAGAVAAHDPSQSRRSGGGSTPGGLKTSIVQWAVIAVLLAVSAASINTAYTVQIVPYVIAIKRMSIIIVVLYGALVLGEKEVGRRFSGAVLMVAGAAMIVLFG